MSLNQWDDDMLQKQAAIAARAGCNVDGTPPRTEPPTTEELAIAAFEAEERTKALMVMNTPWDYAERRQAAVDLAKARETCAKAQRALDDRINGST